jgi:glutamine cyclotransferase
MGLRWSLISRFLVLGLLLSVGSCSEDPTKPIEPPPPGVLALAPGQLDYSIGDTAAVVTVSNDGEGRLAWSATTTVEWLSANPSSGTTTSEVDTIVVGVIRDGLTAGLYSSHLHVDAGGEADSVLVRVEIVDEPVSTYRVLGSYPHDPAAFTQGLVLENGVLFEGTGRYGQSSIRRVDLETGAVLDHRDLLNQYFGEGITIFADRILQLTWTNGVGLVYNPDPLVKIDEFTYEGQGWGLTHDDTRLILSDGTARLRFFDPETFAETGYVDVTDKDGDPIANLNELEYIEGEVYANIWYSDRIVRIDPGDGSVSGWIDLAGLLDGVEGADQANVLNGIAWNGIPGQLLVTGKLWPRLFLIELVPVR